VPPQSRSGAAKPKASLGQALRNIFSKNEENEEGKVTARRRKFVMAAVLGSLSVNFLMFLRFFFPRALYEPKTKFRIGYPSDLGHLHAPGLHTRLESQRKQVQVPLPRQRLRPRRH